VKGHEAFYFGNPVNSYLFIKHLTTDWSNIEKMLPPGFKNLVKKKFSLILTA
jgi:hypothetical protein